MHNDRNITISVGTSRHDTNWKPSTMLLSELYARLQTPQRSTETMEAYLTLKKPQQDGLKDVGGFVGGPLDGPRRKAGAVRGRDLVTLDLDSLPAGAAEDVLRRLDALGCGYCVYSTRKHRPDAPRLRAVIPLDRTSTADEYEPAARLLAKYIQPDMAWFDPTTFEASRLMYWPSCCAGAEYIYNWADKPFVSVDELLAKYTDWRDCTAWPQVPGAQAAPGKLAEKQGDPEAKPGTVGVFCRTYDVAAAIERFLPGVYEETGIPGRYTFTGGSTTGGAVVYDNGKFLFSHHATDPAGGRLVNAFDLVRLHRFGGLDDTAQPGTPTNKLPSYISMLELAAADDAVKRLTAKEQEASLRAAFAGGLEADDSGSGLENLERDKNGKVRPTIDNIKQILEHDPNLRGRFALNEFAGRGEVRGPLPWDTSGKRRLWGDNDNAGLYWYLEKFYSLSANGKTDNALSLHSHLYAFNDVTDYLEGLQWDGVPRLDTLFIDYLGAEDTPYVRTVTRKAFAAAAARAMSPGVKYDIMTILSGPQGIGKSTLISKMSRGWFNDSIRTFEGKDASELLQGVWLVEIAELEAFRNSDINRIKQFVSQQADRFRAAYGRHVSDLPRRCVFFGTTNSSEYLRDRTGNRRFWPVDTGVAKPKKSVFRDLDNEIDQLWAEAVLRWRMGEQLYLSGELEKTAKAIQEDHRESSAREGLIQEFVNRQVPEDWSKWGRDQRNVFWGGNLKGDTHLTGRKRVCALEVWCEAFGGDPKGMRYADAREINEVIVQMPGWEKAKKALWFGCYGMQRGFENIKQTEN